MFTRFAITVERAINDSYPIAGCHCHLLVLLRISLSVRKRSHVRPRSVLYMRLYDITLAR